MPLEPIERKDFEQPDRQEVQDSVIEAVQTDPEQFLRAYIEDERSYGDRYISADLFRWSFTLQIIGIVPILSYSRSG